jgi:hypothetical protein
MLEAMCSTDFCGCSIMRSTEGPWRVLLHIGANAAANLRIKREGPLDEASSATKSETLLCSCQSPQATL